mmetsp:Transcript_13239/g.37771  ORF Transcript_13239/g.37771 Transcript_13239/m.37771 type:complete len:362 (+) Transcript_13239:1528-2613(+)
MTWLDRKPPYRPVVLRVLYLVFFSCTVQNKILQKNNMMSSIVDDKNNVTATNITIVMQHPRHDRLGSNIQRPFILQAYALCKGHTFCIVGGREGVAKVFRRLPTCSTNLFPPVGTIFESEENTSGTYFFLRNENAALRAFSENVDCMLRSTNRALWRDIVFSARQYQENKSIASENLFGTFAKGGVPPVIIAVHIRRGDISKRRRDIFIPDEVYHKVLMSLELIIKKLNRSSEFHIFSEDYGDTNWSGYRKFLSSSQNIHLAPSLKQRGEHAMDIALNLRDWKALIEADILLVGGTFSRVASYARGDMQTSTGLPLTISPCRSDLPCKRSQHYDYSGIYFQYSPFTPYDVKIINMPPPWTL